MVAPADLADGRYDRALDVHAAALAGVLDQTDPAGPSRHTDDPVLRVLHHEKRYWRRSALGVGTDDATFALLADVVALATLFGAATRPQALQLLERWIPDRGRLRRVLTWAGEVYPGSDTLNPLRPDRLGEDHVAASLRAEPGLATEENRQRSADQLLRAFTVLGRAAPRHRDLTGVISELVTADPEPRVPMAMDVATQVEDPVPLVRAISASMSDVADPLVDLAIEHLPETSEALGEFGASTLLRALRIHERLDPPNRPQLAQLNLRLGNTLRALNRPEEALAPVSDAVTAFAALVVDSPGTYRPFEAQALNGRALTLRALGRYAEALDVIELALDRYGSLATDGSAAYRTALADAMDTRAVCLQELDRDDEALAAATETLVVRERLAHNQPALYLPGYAAALNNAALRNREAGRWEEAVRRAREAATVYRRLADDRPDAFRRDYAITLSTLALTESDLGNHDAALAAVTESADQFAWLATQNRQAHLPNLATVTSMRAIRLGNAGRTDEALAVAAEAASLYDELVLARPAVFRPYLAMALNSLANRQMSIGLRGEALTSATRAVELSRRPRDGGGVELSDLAVALNTRGTVLFHLDRLAEAHEVLTECVELRRRLAERNPAAHQPNLAGSVRNLARVAAAGADPERARMLYDDAVAMFADLCERQPELFKASLVETLLDQAELPGDLADSVSALGAAWAVAQPAAGASADRIGRRLSELTADHGDAVAEEWKRQGAPPIPGSVDTPAPPSARGQA